jgi:hypothetical protein
MLKLLATASVFPSGERARLTGEPKILAHRTWATEPALATVIGDVAGRIGERGEMVDAEVGVT